MDLITGLPPQGGKDAILTIVDHGCSRAAIFLPCNTTITGPEIAQLYLEHVFQWFGLPQKIISDHDPQFTSHFSKSIAEKLHIKQNLSTMAHPQTNGLSERKNQWVEQILRILTTILPEAWPKWLPLATAIHNNRRNVTTTLSPNQILIGYDISINPENLPITNNDVIEDRAKTIELYCDTATRLINQTAGTAPVTPSAYQIGSEVWLDATNLHMMGTNTKIDPLRYGPFKIIKEISPVVYQLVLPSEWKIHDVFHTSLLSPYTETDTHGPNFVRPPPDLIGGEQEYEVEHIINHQHTGRGKMLQYLIKWKGYLESDNTWEPTSHLHTPQLIKEYQKRIGGSSIKVILGQCSRVRTPSSNWLEKLSKSLSSPHHCHMLGSTGLIARLRSGLFTIPSKRGKSDTPTPKGKEKRPQHTHKPTPFSVKIPIAMPTSHTKNWTSTTSQTKSRTTLFSTPHLSASPSPRSLSCRPAPTRKTVTWELAPPQRPPQKHECPCRLPLPSLAAR
jgi:Chromo (CHRromatin Organisation MOdifier) domain